jgi:hypothetical protein
LRGQQIVIRDLASGSEKELAETVRRGGVGSNLAWTEDSATLLIGRSSGTGGSEIVAHPVSGRASYSVYTTASNVGRFAMGGGLLALETDISRRNLARTTASPSAQPDIIDPASGYTTSPSFAPDGTLAFLSNRSGTNAIWLMKPGSTPTLLFDGGMSPLGRLRFSPDGTKLAVVSETPQTVAVKIMTRTGATVSTFDMPSVGLGLPSWTPDSKSVLVFDRHSLRTIAISVDNPAQRRPFAPPHWVGIAVRQDGTFATRADKPGIWRIDGAIKLINGTYPAFHGSPLAFRGNDALVPDYEPGGTPRILAQPLSGGASRAAAYAPGAGAQGSDLAVNPLTGEIIYAAQVSHDTNIDLLTLAKR